MAGERSAFIEAPDVEDVNPSSNQKRVNNERLPANKRLPAGRDVHHTNTCSHFTLSEDQTRTESTVAGERTTFVEAPDVEDVNPSMNQKRVSDKSLRDGRHTNTCSNFTSSENTCSDSISSKDDMTKSTVNSFN